MMDNSSFLTNKIGLRAVFLKSLFEKLHFLLVQAPFQKERFSNLLSNKNYLMGRIVHFKFLIIVFPELTCLSLTYQ